MHAIYNPDLMPLFIAYITSKTHDLASDPMNVGSNPTMWTNFESVYFRYF